MKKFIELFELVIQSAKKTKDAKKLKELKKIGEELSVLAKEPNTITDAQVAILADKLKEFQQSASKGEGVASLDISDDQRQINEIIKRGDSDEPATLAYTEKVIDPKDPNYFVKTAAEARLQVEQEAKSLFDNGAFTKEQYLDELGRIKEEYGEGSGLFISSQKADGTYETPSVTNRPQGKSADMQDGAERSIQFVAEKTGLSFEEARLAIMEKMNQGYPIGDLKRTTPNDMSQIKAYLDTNLDYSADDVIEFLEDIEEIAFSGAIDLASDTAKNVSKQNAKQIIDSSLPGDEFGETLIDFDDANLEKAFDRVDNTPDEVLRQEQKPMTLEDTFKNVPPERRAIMEEMYAPIIEEQKIIEATQAEIQQTAAKIQDLIEQGRVDEAEALAESLRDFQTQIKNTDSALDATIIPPNRTLNAKGGRIGFRFGDVVKPSPSNYNPATTLPQSRGQLDIYNAYMDQLPADNPARQRYFRTGQPTLPTPSPTPISPVDIPGGPGGETAPEPSPSPDQTLPPDFLLDEEDPNPPPSFSPEPPFFMPTPPPPSIENAVIAGGPIPGGPIPESFPNMPVILNPNYQPPFTTEQDFNPANPRRVPIPRGGNNANNQPQPSFYETASDFKQGGRVGISSLFRKK